MVDAVVAVQWLEKLQNTLEPYPGAYLALMISALLIAAGLANWVTKRILVLACGACCSACRAPSPGAAAT